MEPSETRLKAAGEGIACALASETDSRAQLAEVRARLLENFTHGQLRGGYRPEIVAPPSWVWRVALGLGTVASSAALAFYFVRPKPITFQVGEEGAQGEPADLVEAHAASTALRFSEGSVMDLQPLARARVLDTASDGARVLLERGVAEVNVVHREGEPTRWAFEAGPFVVAVTGTRFQLGWQPDGQRMLLRMREGSVRISAPCLDAPRQVVQGEHLELSCLPFAEHPATEASERPSEAAVPPSASPSDSEAASAAPLSTLEQALTGSEAPGRAARAAGASSAPAAGAPAAGASPVGASAGGVPTSGVSGSWRALLEAGQLGAAIASAEREGFAAVCNRAWSAELERLANAARSVGRRDLMLEALTALRRRFAGSDEAATAAFSLGRIAFDQRRDYRAAVGWFSAYLKERPNGPLMGDAVGRLMEARHRAGDRVRARADAQRYLERFPNGPYARAAAAILSE